MYPAKPSTKESALGSKIKIEKLSMLPVELLKKQEALRAIDAK